MAGLSIGLPLSRAGQFPFQQASVPHPPPRSGRVKAPVPAPSTLSAEDDQFLNDLEHANFLFFWEQANPDTGLIKDRCNIRTKDTSLAASIASVGFGLTALCIGLMRGFVSYEDARSRVLKTLSFLWHKLPTHRGFFFHFANMNTGERVWDSEVSSVDTAMLLCGALTCREYFQDKDIGDLAHAIFDRVDWTWLAEDTALLSLGWTPEMGFIPSRWAEYSELMMMYLLGMGSTSASAIHRRLVRLEPLQILLNTTGFATWARLPRCSFTSIRRPEARFSRQKATATRTIFRIPLSPRKFHRQLLAWN